MIIQRFASSYWEIDLNLFGTQESLIQWGSLDYLKNDKRVFEENNETQQKYFIKRNFSSLQNID